MIYNESFTGRMRLDYLECLLFIRSFSQSYYKILVITKEIIFSGCFRFVIEEGKRILILS